MLQKPEKVYLENTNYLFALKQETPNVACLRETFFMNQLKANHKLTYPDKGDFVVDEKFVFEIGGKTKSFGQIANLENAYIAADDITTGHGKKCHFGCLGLCTDSPK